MLYMKKMFGMSERFAGQLWRHYDASPTVLWQLGLCAHVPESLEAWTARVRHLNGLMTPTSLLEASQRLSPEKGHARDRQAILFEQHVLEQLDSAGNWRW
jgi:hypothetical protein